MSKIKKPKIFIIAGEVSGDVLGARIMRQMPDVEFVGIGGENMMAAGYRQYFHWAIWQLWALPRLYFMREH